MRPIPENPFTPAPRAEPPGPYRSAGRHLLLPAGLPELLLTSLAGAAQAEIEAGGLLYGLRAHRAGDADVVRAVVVPEQTGNWGYYRVPAEAIAAASSVTRPYGWVTVGQVHSHPGDDVEHSWYDDRHAISSKALSFVLPDYGRDPSAWPDRVGVHEYQNDWWHQLTPDQTAARISFGDAPLDFIDLRA